MKNYYFFLIIILNISCNKGLKHPNPNETINVLFVGNSLTYSNNMPGLLQNMVDETNSNISIEHLTASGKSLQKHLKKVSNVRKIDSGNYQFSYKVNEKFISKLKERDWDWIILQSGTIPVIIPEEREFTTIPVIKEIKNILPDSKFLIFTTWPSYEDYPKSYCYKGFLIDPNLIAIKDYCSEKVSNLDQEFSLIDGGYSYLSEMTKIEKTPHTKIHYNLRKNYPEISVLEDYIHPSKAGAFINALIFYEILTENKASHLKYEGNISSEKATFFKQNLDKKFN